MVSIKIIKPKVIVEMDNENSIDSGNSGLEGNNEISHDESEDTSKQNNENDSDESEIMEENESDSDNDQTDSDNDQMNSDNEQLDSDNDQMDSENDEMNADNDQTDSDNDQPELNDVQIGSNIDQTSTNDERTDNLMIKNEGWADSLAKILKTNKPKNKKILVLSRAKKDSEVKVEKKEEPSFEVEGANKEIKEVKADDKDIELETTQVKLKRKLEFQSARIKPTVLEKDRERKLQKIATKGVVQLFNVVRNQQKNLQQKMEDVTTENEKEKVLKSFDKKAFLDVLMGQSHSVTVEDAKTEPKGEPKPEPPPKWSALRDDFMMGAKMKDWDKITPEEDL